MDKNSRVKSGFTLVEVLVSVAIMLIFLPFAASMLTNSQLLSSYAKHKIQAVYVAQQLIETQRQNIATIAASVGPISTNNPNVTLGNGPISVKNPYTITGLVTLDTKGTYPAVSCLNANLPCGTDVITVTPSVYTLQSGAAAPASTNIYHFLVTISWNEQILSLKVPMTEYYAEDIVNDPMLN